MKQACWIIGLAGLSLAAPASASINWTLYSGASGCSTSGSTYGNTRTCSGSGSGSPAVTASAWANTYNSSNTKIENAYLGAYTGGLGVKNRDAANGTDAGEGSSPEHAMDNNDRIDSILFSFTDSVVLESVRTGWYWSDSDVSVLRYKNSDTPSLGMKTYADLVSATGGWELVSTVDLDSGSCSSGVCTKSVNAGGADSKYWLVSAYTTAFGTVAGSDTGNDYVKIYALSGDRPTPPPPGGGVPEPGSMALIGIAALGLLATRRRG